MMSAFYTVAKLKNIENRHCWYLTMKAKKAQTISLIVWQSNQSNSLQET